MIPAGWVGPRHEPGRVTKRGAHSWQLTGTRSATATTVERGIYTCRHCRLVVESSQLPRWERGEIWGGVIVRNGNLADGRPRCRRNPLGE